MDFYRDRPTFSLINGLQAPDQVTADLTQRHRGRPGGGRRGGSRSGARMIVCKSPAELERMKAANQLVAEVLAALREAVRPGVTTGDLDAMAESQIRAGGA